MGSSKSSILSVLLITLSLSGFFLLSRIHDANAASFTLFGRVLAPAGWGPTSSSVVSPGPTLVVQTGESVTVKLASADGITHNWGVDYNGDGLCEAGEPCSTNFVSQTTFTFTATTTPGNYTYWCFIHKGPMTGTFTVKAVHDVAVGAVAVSRNFTYAGVTPNTFHVNVTAQNPGGFPETFFVYARVNATLIQNVSISLPAGGFRLVMLNWTGAQLAALSRGKYFLTANVTTVNGETNLGNNQLLYGIFTVKLKGDVNGDCKVDIVDLSSVGAQFGKNAGNPGFNINTDLNNDNTINIQDLVIVASAFGSACP